MAESIDHPKLSYGRIEFGVDGVRVDDIHLDGYKIAQNAKIERLPAGMPVQVTLTLYADDVTVTEAALHAHGATHLDFTTTE